MFIFLVVVIGEGSIDDLLVSVALVMVGRVVLDEFEVAERWWE